MGGRQKKITCTHTHTFPSLTSPSLLSFLARNRSTADRRNGQTALTVLKPNSEAMREAPPPINLDDLDNIRGRGGLASPTPQASSSPDKKQPAVGLKASSLLEHAHT